MTTMSLVKPTGIKMNRILICSVCKKEWVLRWGIMANESLSKHMKEHQ
jgi:hypothetical protein